MYIKTYKRLSKWTDWIIKFDAFEIVKRVGTGGATSEKCTAWLDTYFNVEVMHRYKYIFGVWKTFSKNITYYKTIVESSIAQSSL